MQARYNVFAFTDDVQELALGDQSLDHFDGVQVAWTLIHP
jgi:hypothetical protein